MKQTGFNLKQRVVDLENQLKRAVADYRNLESRISQGRSELTSFVGAQLIRKLLPVLDHLEQVVDLGQPILSERSESKDWFKGVELAVKQLQNVLQSEGLDEIVAEGQFDPAFHEALDTEEGEDNKILKVVRKGYTLNGKVIRPAQVVVGRKGDVIASEARQSSTDEEEQKGEES